VYTKDEVFYIPKPLKQLEEHLSGLHFVRISKAALVNIFKIKSAANGLHFRMTVEMMNDERIIVGRRYREDLIDAINELAKDVMS
jgi:DNA-binding LytR/AlgR family response regulator